MRIPDSVGAHCQARALFARLFLPPVQPEIGMIYAARHDVSHPFALALRPAGS
jgi:hypothetical protein